MNIYDRYLNSKIYFRALVIGEKMWEWLCDNPDKDKEDWPLYKKYKKYLTPIEHCSICYARLDFFSDFMCGGAPKGGMDKPYMRKCILSNLCGRYYSTWEYRRNIDVRRKYATKVYFAILKERLRRM